MFSLFVDDDLCWWGVFIKSAVYFYCLFLWCLLGFLVSFFVCVYVCGGDKMLSAAMDVLAQLGILPVIQMVAIAVGAIFIYRYFTDRG